jgi:hypothetical protein
LTDELKNKYIFAKPIITKEQADTAIRELLAEVDDKWADFLERNSITNRNLIFAITLTKEPTKKPEAEKILD